MRGYGNINLRVCKVLKAEKMKILGGKKMQEI